MNTAVVETKSFEERMFDRIKENMGDLMTSEELKKILETAMERAFFQSVVIKSNSWGGGDSVKEPYIVSMVRKEMEPMVREAVRNYLKEHEAQVLKTIDETIAKGFFDLVKQHMEQAINQPMWQFKEQLMQKGILIP
jgi:hypothetical protein